MATPRAKALASLPLFAGLSGRDREIIASNLDEVSFPSSTTLITQGDSNDTFYVLTEGEADVSVSGQPRARMRRGDFFGEISMDHRVLATATVVARTPVSAYVMSHAQFRALAGSPKVLARLQAAVGNRLASDRMIAQAPRAPTAG
jgi:cAMP-dependent protein kinase regulator